MRAVIADTSCLIIFAKLNRLDVLQGTFNNLTTTEPVAEEFGTLPEWIEVSRAYDQNLYIELAKTLGAGESSCICLALQNRDSLLIIDDRQARKIAEEMEVECVGSLGVLLIAKQQGVIERVSPLLASIRDTDFRVSAEVVVTVRRLAGEL